jgi:hypothetical protein
VKPFFEIEIIERRLTISRSSYGSNLVLHASSKLRLRRYWVAWMSLTLPALLNGRGAIGYAGR